jgi:hypothetical protein
MKYVSSALASLTRRHGAQPGLQRLSIEGDADRAAAHRGQAIEIDAPTVAAGWSSCSSAMPAASQLVGRGVGQAQRDVVEQDEPYLACRAAEASQPPPSAQRCLRHLAAGGRCVA